MTEDNRTTKEKLLDALGKIREQEEEIYNLNKVIGELDDIIVRLENRLDQYEDKMDGMRFR